MLPNKLLKAQSCHFFYPWPKLYKCIQMDHLWHWIVAQSASRYIFISNTSLSLRYPFWNSCRRHMKRNSLMSHRARTLWSSCHLANWTNVTDRSNAGGCNAGSGNFLERNWSSNPFVSVSCNTRKMRNETEGESNCCNRLDWEDWRSLIVILKPEERKQTYLESAYRQCDTANVIYSIKFTLP